MRGEWKRSGNWDYFMRFCFDKTDKSYGNFTYLFQSNLPNLQVSFYDDQKNSWDSVYKSNDNCTTKNSKAKATNDVVSDVFRFAQFKDTKSSHMWYFTLSDCTQKKNPEILLTDMDVHIFNQIEGKKNQEFSCEEQGLLALYALFFVFYFLIGCAFAFIIKRFNKEKEISNIYKILAFVIVTRFFSCLLIMAHFASFASNGMGSRSTRIFGEVIGSISTAFLIMLVLLVANGYGITNENFSKKRSVVATVILYFLLSILLIIAAYVDLDRGSQYYVFEAIPGIFLLILRFVVLGFFLIMIIPNSKAEKNHNTKDFYAKFGITSVIWLIYLPLIVFIGFACSPTYREKFVSAFSACIEYIFLILLIVWFWPTKLSQYNPITVKDVEKETEKNEKGFYQVASEKSDSGTSSSSEDSSEDDLL
ncbi:intimal thickness receptor-related [Anaeramoeba flamelloides]|uniref:Intimal thickness receptor-related n=1 Tax=Anaeramoeba flamelloides TaxID=1746091 RepID=A0AAV7Y6R3_9EUKA|nr:intimal thickness receptor-related [Anaeramoeba flamelloides]KAJ6240200.1 intimal thickness receptor-related [Anaeramoeba flamelloides]